MLVVEGVTEVVFLHNLMEYLVSADVYLAVRWLFRVAGKWQERVYGIAHDETDELHILLISQAEMRRFAHISERIHGWAAAGYSAVIGLRDLYRGREASG